MRRLFSFLSLFLFAGSFICPCVVEAQGQFILSGEIRERGLYSHGYMGMLDKSRHGVFWVGQRTRLGFDYQNKNLGFFVQLEDGRIWGETSGMHTPYGFGIAQAWFHAEFAQRFSLKIGRMPIVYEDGRYFAYSLWDECGNASDALMLRYRSLDGRTKVDLGASASNNSASRFLNPYGLDDYYKYLLIAYVSHRFNDDFRWSALSVTDFQERHYHAFADSAQTIQEVKTDPTKIYARTAIGTYFDICRDRKLSALVYAYGQFGKDLFGRNIVAGMASAIVSYKPHPTVEIKAAYDYISGNEDASAELSEQATDHAFNRFMGSGHSFLGIMDLFSGSGRQDITLGSDYHQPYLTFSYFPEKRHFIALNACYFWTANDIADIDSRNLGLEMSLIYKYDILPDLKLTVGYALHSRTKTLETLSGIAPGNSRLPHYGYVMIAYKPFILNTANHPKKEK
ncbi:MAG: hypothetical protein NC324_05665 [Bacteroides sp.]|nr:hypothetical protein [Bacteroides sp.]